MEQNFFCIICTTYLIFNYLWHVEISNKINMANKRTLKRSINYICGDLFAEVAATSLYNKDVKQENVDALLTSILRVHNDFIRRVSHPEPGLAPKAYYKAIIEDFNKQAIEIVDHIQNL